MKDFRELKVWQKARELIRDIYLLSSQFPKEELYGLTNQIRRSAVSIAANIAEGCGRDSDAELLRFCRIAMGSASELECELLIAKDLNWIDDIAYNNLAENLVIMRRMLNSLIQTLRKAISG